ncbi:MAG: UDP-N-acetylmuramoyl-L-alanyl-D-glutamate--2,6-diaminopimelate ligase [Clostridia bacterium]|nr:UDP-N-acetylmuramoyl-L-alanyl-D-glutamate--2,6-diaminopimelate ligase [Clostridia bacterium]
MILSEIAGFLSDKGLLRSAAGDEGVEIISVTDDSREASKGCLFVCKGAGFKKEYLEDAIKKGAVCYLSEKDYGVNARAALFTDELLKAFAAVSGVFYGFPTDDLIAVGVTGTKGKTTTCEMIKTILSVSHGCAIIGTNGVDTTKRLYDNNLTTPESLKINRYLREAADNGAKYAVIETSAQAFKMHRADFLHFKIGVFTNFGLDHIGPKEHPDVEDYFRCKTELFKNCETAVIYGDGEEYERVLETVKNIPHYTFGMDEKNDFYARELAVEGRYLAFTLCSEYMTGRFRISILGDFNVLNALAAIACAYILGIDKADIQKGLERIFVSGRMEIFEKAGKTVIVDYAHNRLSYERLIENVKRDFPDKKIVSVFGCPGTKALNRRKDMGEVAAEYSDFTVLTAEDPDTEPPEKTMDEIAVWLDKKNKPYIKIADRKDAVEYAVKNAAKDEVVLILGKGNEKTMMYDGVYKPHEGDADITARLLGAKRGAAAK